MIQILGLREFTDKNTGEIRRFDSHFNNGWRAESLQDLFANLETFVEAIPEDQRWNMFYTVSTCEEKKGRVFVSQDVLPIDIDGADPTKLDEITSVVLAELGLEAAKTGIVYSGHGIHLLIGLKNTITDVNYFKANKVYYKALCGRINFALYNAGLKGSADTTVFSGARLLRLPMTENRKDGKTPQPCRLINRHIVPIDIDLISLSDLPNLHEGDHIHPKALVRFPDPDTKAVQEGCGFLQHCYNKQEEVSEPQWYAMMSIIGRLENGAELVHEYSKDNVGYSPDKTDFKLEHALDASGPRTCENINQFYDGCKECPHFKKITSPIQIVGEDFIRTKDTGFYDIVIKNGAPTRGKPNYNDLVKYFGQQNEYFTLEDSELTFIHNGTHWVDITKLYVHNFAERMFNPSPSTAMCSEFESKLKRVNIRPADFTNTQGFLNFKNGVLDLEEMELLPHTTEKGFTYCIPYNYEYGDKCPVFDKFISDVTLKNEELAELLLEYIGYAISGTDPKLVQMCAILHGGGGNGKSVLLDVVRSLVGEENCSAVGLKNMCRDTGRYAMMNKAINVSDETPTDAFLESADFKSLVSGDTVEIRRLYHNPIIWRCSTKLLFACNDLPYTNDFSDGLYRRLIIIPFKAKFSDEMGNKDPFMLEKLLEERPAILHKILSHYRNFKERGYKFKPVKVILEEKEDYREMGDSVMQFSLSMCEFKKGVTIDLQTAYRCYVAWARELEMKIITYNTFVRRFGKTLVGLDGVETSRIAVGRSKQTVYNNLSIKATSHVLM